MAKTKDKLKSAQGRQRIRRNTEVYIADLETYRVEAYQRHNLELASTITMRLLEHAIGKPVEKKAIELDALTTIKVIVTTPDGTRLFERSARPMLGSNREEAVVNALLAEEVKGTEAEDEGDFTQKRGLSEAMDRLYEKAHK